MIDSLFTSAQPSILEQVIQINSGCLFQMKMTAKRTFDLVWMERGRVNTKAQAQLFFDELGSLGFKSLELHYALQTWIKVLEPSYVMLTAPYTYTVTDGVVTIGDLVL